MKKFLLVMLMAAGVAGCAPLAPDGCKKRVRWTHAFIKILGAFLIKIFMVSRPQVLKPRWMRHSPILTP